MKKEPLQVIEQKMSLLARLLTAKPSDPVIASMDRSAYLILCELALVDARAISALADEFFLDISTASRQVAALEEKDLVERFTDPADGRTNLLRITAVGRVRLHAVQKARHDLYQKVLNEWTPEELAGLETTLNRLTLDLKRWKLARRAES